MKVSTLVGLGAALLQAKGAFAFWRMQCGQPILTDRIDPLVQPGISPGKHVHNIMGGNAFDKVTSFDILQKSDCTSCQIKGDKSIYWVPSLYFQGDDGSFEQVPQLDGMLVYYIPERGGDKVELFPPGFGMLAGDPNLRTFDEAAGKTNEKGRRQLAIGFNCLNYGLRAEAFAERREMPSKEEMKKCKDGLRADILFPSCWNGELGSADHRSHVAYPNDVEDGTCPDTHQRRLITMKFETSFNVAKFSDRSGRFVWSTGDLTGLGYHGDFVNGWVPELLQAAYDDPTCVTPNMNPTGGNIFACQTFVNRGELQDMGAMNKCKTPSISKQEYAGPFNKLPGCNPVQGEGTAFDCEAENKPSAPAPKPEQQAPPTTLSTTSKPKPTTTPTPTTTTTPKIDVPSSIVVENQQRPETTANPVVEVQKAEVKNVKPVIVTVVETVFHTVVEEHLKYETTYVEAEPTGRSRRRRHNHHHQW